MDLQYLVGPSALGIVVGFIMQQLFSWLTEGRRHRNEIERIEIQHRTELRKRFFDAKFEAALSLARTLKASVQMLRSQMVLHGASLSEGRADVEAFRSLRDGAFAGVQKALTEGHEAAAVMDLLFKDVSFSGLPFQAPLSDVTFEWQDFINAQSAFLQWLGSTMAELPPKLPADVLEEKNRVLDGRMQELRNRVGRLMELTDRYDDAVTETIVRLGAALEP